MEFVSNLVIRVYYKCPNGKEWKGPGTVIGQNGVVIFVRHGGMMIKVHECRLTKTVETLEKDDKKSIVKENLNLELPNMGNIDDCSENDVESSEKEEKEEDVRNGHEFDFSIGNENRHENQTPTIPNIEIGQKVRFSNFQTGGQCIAEVTSKAGKATGKNKNWYNMKYLEPEDMKGAEISVDLSKVENLETIHSEQEQELEPNEDVMVTNDVSFKEAKIKELLSWKNNNVYM